MRVTIIRDDNNVMVDGVPYGVDCSALPADVHAVQWDGVRGEVEYAPIRCEHCNTRSKKGNEDITDFAPYQPYVDAWSVAKAAAEKAAAELQAKLDAERVAAEKEGALVTGPQG